MIFWVLSSLWWCHVSSRDVLDGWISRCSSWNIIRVLYIILILISLVWTVGFRCSFFFDLPISLTVRKQISKLYIYEIRFKNEKKKQQLSSQFWWVFTKTIPCWPLRLSTQVFQIKWTKQCFFNHGNLIIQKLFQMQNNNAKQWSIHYRNPFLHHNSITS